MATLTIGNNRGKFLFQIAYDHVSKERRFKEKELKPFRGNMLKDPVNIAHMRCAAGRWFEEKKAANMGLPPAASQSGSPFVPLSSRVMHGECTRADGLRWQRMNANTGSLTRWKEKGNEGGREGGRGSPESTDRMASLPRSQRTWP